MNMPDIKPSKYLRYLVLPSLFGTQRTKEILIVNPTVVPHREEAQQVSVSVFDYNSESLEEKQFSNVEDVLAYKQNNRISWINIDGLRKIDVENSLQLFWNTSTADGRYLKHEPAAKNG